MADFNKIRDQFRNLNLRDPGTWPILPRIATALGVVLLVLILGYFLYWSDQIDQLHALQDQEETLKKAYRDKLTQAVNLEPLRKQKDQVAQYVFRLEKQLPSKAEMDALLSDINQAGVGRGLQFELFRPGQSNVKDYYAELPIEIRIVGNYHDLGQFTSDIAGLPRIVTLNNLAISAPAASTTASSANLHGDVLTMDAIAKTFRYLDPEEIAAQRKAKAAAQKGQPK
ncbi:MAG: type 4a pilus biogenesis protein PilO [Burkholderiaceae bacterium]|jgi:type IV pilus assembly protein PilO